MSTDATEVDPAGTPHGFIVEEGALVQLGHVAPDGSEIPLVHLQAKDGLTACGVLFRVRGVRSTTERTETTCGACQSD